MSDGESLLNKQQRKKARRKERKKREREAHRNLDDVTTEAVDQALQLVPLVADAKSKKDREHVIDIELASMSEAQFIRKRVNDALNVGEWLDAVRVWIWQASDHRGTARSDRGEEAGFEIRLTRLSVGE